MGIFDLMEKAMIVIWCGRVLKKMQLQQLQSKRSKGLLKNGSQVCYRMTFVTMLEMDQYWRGFIMKSTSDEIEALTTNKY